MGYEFGVRRQGSASTTNTLWNTIALDVAADGTRSVGVSDAAAWRTALGLGSNATSSTAYLPLTGGTMTGQVQGSQSGQYWQGRDKAIVRGVGTTNSAVYRPLVSGQSNTGSWEIGPYNDALNFVWVPDTVYASGTNTGFSTWTISNTGVFSGYAALLKTSNVGGYVTDSYGNFKHQSTTSTNNWNIINNSGTNVFTVNFETGATAVANSITINNNHYFITKATDYSGSSTPSSNTYRVLVLGQDSTGTDRAYIRSAAFTNGTQGIQIETKRVVSNTNYYNTLSLLIDASGTKSVSISDAAAWRTALGLGTMATQSSGSYLPISGGTLTGGLTGTSMALSSGGLTINSKGSFVAIRRDDITHTTTSSNIYATMIAMQYIYTPSAVGSQTKPTLPSGTISGRPPTRVTIMGNEKLYAICVTPLCVAVRYGNTRASATEK